MKKLEMILGEDERGKIVRHELNQMLLAGCTGSGKSVGINNIILSLMTEHTPEELKFALVDPKVVEYTMYQDNPYLLTNPVTSMKDVCKLMIHLNHLMDRRYYEFLNIGNGVKNIEQANAFLSSKEMPIMPRIVMIVDEWADVMVYNKEKDIDKLVARIAQKGRSVGIHMILSTQAPRREVLSGLIKASVYQRLSYMVTSSIESQIILDETGAEKLHPRGDLIFVDRSEDVKMTGQSFYTNYEDMFRLTEGQKKKWRDIRPMTFKELMDDETVIVTNGKTKETSREIMKSLIKGNVKPKKKWFSRRKELEPMELFLQEKISDVQKMMATEKIIAELVESYHNHAYLVTRFKSSETDIDLDRIYLLFDHMYGDHQRRNIKIEGDVMTFKISIHPDYREEQALFRRV